MQYRRAKTPGGTYFFTLVTYQRQKLFSTPQTIDLLRQSFRIVTVQLSLGDRNCLGLNL
jgi:putative transposase